MNPLPDQPAPETLEEAAERHASSFAEDWALTTEAQRDLEYEILSALRNERERCAKVAEDRAEVYRRKSRSESRRGDHSLSEHFLSECNAALEIAQAIRKGR